ncbi:MAG: tetratricopeptide repeat protein [Rhodospirillales bacterium]|nr:tetratricopeptide repeat protein [Rhodospirillales bacterium]
MTAVIESGAAPGERYDAYVTRAEIRGKSGDYQGAVDDLTAAIGIDPNIAATHAARGMNYLSLNEWEMALADADKALSLGDRELVGSISFVRATALMALRRFEEALAAAARVPQSDPRYVAARYVRGSAFDSLGHRRRALREFNLVVKNDPTYRDVWISRGEVLLALDRAEDALFDFDMALRLNPLEDAAKIHKLRGDALAILSRTEEAQEAYRRAQEAERQAAQ